MERKKLGGHTTTATKRTLSASVTGSFGNNGGSTVKFVPFESDAVVDAAVEAQSQRHGLSWSGQIPPPPPPGNGGRRSSPMKQKPKHIGQTIVMTGISLGEYKECISKGVRVLSVRDMMRTCGTGDLLLFESISLFGLTISAFSLDRWAHVAMIVKLEPDDPLMNRIDAIGGDSDGGALPPSDDDNKSPRLFLWESVRKNQLDRDLITGKINKSGPQLVDLEERLKNHFEMHDGSIGFRKLTLPRSIRYKNGTLVPDLREKLDEMIMAYSVSRYEDNKLRLIDSLLKCTPFNCACPSQPEDLDQEDKVYFCSQLQAETYLRLGILEPEKGRESKHYTVIDFTQSKEDLMFKRDCHLGFEFDVIYITKPSPVYLDDGDCDRGGDYYNPVLNSLKLPSSRSFHSPTKPIPPPFEEEEDKDHLVPVNID